MKPRACKSFSNIWGLASACLPCPPSCSRTSHWLFWRPRLLAHLVTVLTLVLHDYQRQFARSHRRAVYVLAKLANGIACENAYLVTATLFLLGSSCVIRNPFPLAGAPFALFFCVLRFDMKFFPLWSRNGCVMPVFTASVKGVCFSCGLSEIYSLSFRISSCSSLSCFFSFVLLLYWPSCLCLFFSSWELSTFCLHAVLFGPVSKLASYVNERFKNFCGSFGHGGMDKLWCVLGARLIQWNVDDMILTGNGGKTYHPNTDQNTMKNENNMVPMQYIHLHSYERWRNSARLPWVLFSCVSARHASKL